MKPNVGVFAGFTDERLHEFVERSHLVSYQTAFAPMLLGVFAAMILTGVLRETGPAVRA